MKTPPMFYPQEDGKLTEIPDEHAKILDLYRDRMPLVHEPQYSGDPIGLYPLIIEEQEPLDAPEPTALESKRLGGDPYPADFERLAVLAIRAHLDAAGVFAGSLAHDDGVAAVGKAVSEETAHAGRKLRTAVDKAVRNATAEIVEGWWVTA